MNFKALEQGLFFLNRVFISLTFVTISIASTEKSGKFKKMLFSHEKNLCFYFFTLRISYSIFSSNSYCQWNEVIFNRFSRVRIDINSYFTLRNVWNMFFCYDIKSYLIFYELLSLNMSTIWHFIWVKLYFKFLFSVLKISSKITFPKNYLVKIQPSLLWLCFRFRFRQLNL